MTGYRLDGLGIKSLWGRDFCTYSDQPWGPPSLLYNGYQVFPRGKYRPGQTLTPPYLLVPWSRKSRAIPLLPLWAVRPVQNLSACTVQLYLYSPYGPYGLYSASVPVQYSYTSTPPMGHTARTVPQCLYSTAVPLLPLWAIRPVQCLSACTVQLYLYSPYGPYSLYSASVPVQYSYTSTPPMGRTACTDPQCLYSTAIPLLPLWAVRPVQTLSGCTVQLYLYSPYGPYGLYRASVPVQYSYTSTPPVGRTTFTEPQCLYKGAHYLYLYQWIDTICRLAFELHARFTWEPEFLEGIGDYSMYVPCIIRPDFHHYTYDL